MTFSGLAEHYAKRSTCFSAFAQTRGLFETLIDTIELLDRPATLREDVNDAQTREHEPQIQSRATDVQEDESYKNWICYLAMKLDASSLMLIPHYCVNNRGLGDCQKPWQLLQQRFRSDETTTVISLMRQIASLQLREDKSIHQCKNWSPDCIMLVGSFLGRCLMHCYLTAFQIDTSILWCGRVSILQNFVKLCKRLTNFEEG